jgi:hypothetical protein
MSIFKGSISWADLGYPDKPDRFSWLDGELIIEPKHIENWKQNPAAVYKVSFGGSFNGIRKYTLGGWV